MNLSGVFTRRASGYVFWAVVVGAALNGAYIHRSQLKAAVRPPGKPIPYTVILQDYVLQTDGSASPTFRFTWALRGDGSRVMEGTNSDPKKPFSQRILYFASGKAMTVMEHERRKSTTFDPVRNAPARRVPDPNNNCLVSGQEGERVAGEEVIGGYRTVKLTAGPATQWLALDYGCALIKDRAEWGDGQVSEKRLVALIPGEPSPALFDDPVGFEEVTTSKLFPGEPNSDGIDAYYNSHRPPVGVSEK
jgi:hypothetical protein